MIEKINDRISDITNVRIYFIKYSNIAQYYKWWQTYILNKNKFVKERYDLLVRFMEYKINTDVD